MSSTPTCFRIYTGADGESHVEDLAFGKPGTPMELATAFPAVALSFRRTNAGSEHGFHHAPRRQFVVIAAGGLEVMNGLGETRRLGPGSVMLAEDRTGKGHQANTDAGVDRVSLNLALELHALDSPSGPTVPSGITYVSIYPGDDGKSHFREVELQAPASPDGGPVIPPWMPVKDAHFASYPPGQPERMRDLHPAPRRQFLVTLAGEMEMIAGDGESRVFGPGAVLLAEDMGSSGHRNRIVSDEPWHSLVIVLEEEAST